MKARLLLAALPFAAACSPATPPAQAPSLAAGERAYQKCFACHATEAGRNDLSGPTLYRILGRRIAAEPGFDYSAALQRFASNNPVWTRELVDRFATDPEALVPGTSMVFHGMPDAQERRAFLRYLEGLGD